MEMCKPKIIKLFLFILIFFSGIKTGFSQVDLDAGLVVHLPMNGNTNDVSGNNNHGTGVNAIALTTDRFGIANRAYELDGIDDFIKIADPAQGLSTTPFSNVLWFYAETNQVKALLGKRDYGPTNGQQYQLSIFRDASTTLSSAVVSSELPCSGDLTPSVLDFASYTGPLCLNRWYCVVVTFDGKFHRIFLDGIKVSESVPHFPKMVECPSELRLGNWWEGDPLNFKGKLDDFRWYNRVLNEEEIEALSNDRPAAPLFTLDFQFSQLECNPKGFVFKVTQSSGNGFRWEYGDGGTGTGSNTQHVYNSFGNFPVKLIVGDGFCADTVEKVITTTHQKQDIIQQQDTVICKGSEVILRAKSQGTYCWNGTTASNEITVKPDKKTTYLISTLKDGPNLIVNGNFSSGNSGYTSDYFYTSPNSGTGQIFIGKDPETWNPDFCNACGDHTTGTGNFLMVNASLVSDSRVWYKNVIVTKNTNYVFSFWIFSGTTSNHPSIDVKINNKPIGNYTRTSIQAGNWTNVIFNWNSENENSAAISITSTNFSTAEGNDFGIDDISFYSRTVVIDSVTIDVKDAIGKLIAIPDTSICPGEHLQLFVSGSTQVKWTPATGLSDPSVLNPIANPVSTIRYVVSETAPGKCPANDTVLVTLKDKPKATVSNDTTLCKGRPGLPGVQISASGGESFNWFPSLGLSNVNIGNPIANPSATTKYNVEVTGKNGCADTAEVLITVAAFVNVKASDDVTICFGKQVTINAVGAADYFWAPSTGLSSATVSNPVANPTITTTYIVSSASAGFCSGRDTVTVTVNQLPLVSVTPGDTLICNGSEFQLNAYGGSQYEWSPLQGLTNASISNPWAKPNSKTTYHVNVTDVNGCSAEKDVTVDVRQVAVLSASEDKEICAGSTIQLQASGGSNYHWFPSTGLSNPEISNPTARPLQTTTYIVSSPDADVCSRNDTVLIVVNKLPAISVTPNEPFVCSGDRIQLFATGAGDFVWTPASGLSNSTIAAPFANPLVTTTYQVTGTDLNGCRDSIHIKVVVGPAGKIFIPNAFTPNGDGLNDCYSIKNAIGAENFELAIFNRWGERVYYSKNPDGCWDGSYKGVPQPAGNFVYYLRVKSACGSIDEKGTIALIR